jgi:NAD-dependent SIR2 family protein deacetylase
MLIITDGFPRNLGYLEIDQRGLGENVKGTGTMHLEADTYTCSHCQYVVWKNSKRSRARYFCKSCQHHICDNCAAIHEAAGRPRCITWNQRLEEAAETEARQLQSPQLILPSKEI